MSWINRNLFIPRFLLLLLIASLSPTLSSFFGEAVRLTEEPINPNLPRAYFSAKNSIRVANDTLHTVYMRPAANGLFEVVYSQFTGNNLYSFSLDSFSSYTGNITEPVLEITPEGHLMLLYHRSLDTTYKGNEPYVLYRLVVDEAGEIVSRDSTLSFINNRNQTLLYDYKYNLLLKKGEPVPTDVSYMYFTDSERFTDGAVSMRIYWEGDVIYGNVHSNTDIYMRANSWPRFYGRVTTAGMVRITPGGGTNYPRDQIFRGELIEHYHHIRYDARAREVRKDAFYPFGEEERDNAIAFITVDGSSYSGMTGEIITEDVDDPEFDWIEGVNQFTVYSGYPPYGPIGQIVDVNRIPRRDTLWTPFNDGILENGSIFVPMELWISGNISGKQTWASSHNIYLKGDLTYTNTPIGQRPDGIDENGNATLPVNETDYLGIISEHSIYIQYGHRSPLDSLRYRPNTQDIYLYGAYCALRKETSIWNNGVFTAQYLYPKGSTPSQMFEGERYTNIDLHLFRYPTGTQNPWPPGLDYPWYNPLWPEPGRIINVPRLPDFTPNPNQAPEVVMDRGTVYIFGSRAQRIFGALGIIAGGDISRQWDIYNEINPLSPPTYGTVPNGRAGYSAGQFYEDLRFQHTAPQHLANTGIFNNHHTSFQYMTSEDGIDFDVVLSGSLDNFNETLNIATFEQNVVIVKGNSVFLYENESDDYTEFELHLSEDESILDVIFNYEGLFILTAEYPENAEVYDSKVYLYSFKDNLLTLKKQNNLPYLMQTLHLHNGNVLWAAAINENTIEISVCNNPYYEENYRWLHNIPPPNNYSVDQWKENSKIAIQSEGHHLYIAFHYRVIDGYRDRGGDIYAARGIFKLLSPYPAAASMPNPEDGAVDVSVELEELSWNYIVDTLHINPAGFRVYFNTTGEFGDEDEFVWVDFIEEQEHYYCTDILPDRLEGLTAYYWKVVPTTNEPELRGEYHSPDSRKRSERDGRMIYAPTRGDAHNVPVWSFTTVDPTGVEAICELPLLTKLYSNHPNPFNPETTISFSLAEAGEVTIELFNIMGQRVTKLIDGHLDAGKHKIVWKGTDDNNQKAASGVYLYRMKTRDYTAAGKMILMK